MQCLQKKYNDGCKKKISECFLFNLLLAMLVCSIEKGGREVLTVKITRGCCWFGCTLVIVVIVYVLPSLDGSR